MGNKLGWILGGVLAVGVIVVIIAATAFPTHSRPTGATTDPGAMELHKVEYWPRAVVGDRPAANGNAGDDYHKARLILEKNMNVIMSAISGGYKNVPPDSAAMNLLKRIDSAVADGVKKAQMRYTLVHTPKEFRVNHSYIPAQQLEELAGAMETLAKIQTAHQQHAEAINTLKHVFLLGWHMTSERSRGEMLLKGLALRERAAENLLDAYGRMSGDFEAHKSDLRKYLEEAKNVAAIQRSKQSILRSWPAEPGDVFNIAENDEDRAWRVEGILHLGYLKFRQADHRGDMKKINELIEHYIQNGDEMEKAAARAAKDFTREQYRKS